MSNSTETVVRWAKLYGATAALGLLRGAAPAEPASGKYEGLLLGFDRNTSTLTGYFSEVRVGNGTESQPQFSCLFFLRGLADGSADIAVKTWFPGETTVIPGTLRVTEGGVTLQLREPPGGCGMAVSDLANTPYPLSRDMSGAWLAVRVVRAARSVFHAAPEAARAARAFVVRGDPIVVFGRSGAWVEAAFLGPTTTTRGWIRAADLFSDAVPK